MEKIIATLLNIQRPETAHRSTRIRPAISPCNTLNSIPDILPMQETLNLLINNELNLLVMPTRPSLTHL